MGQATPFKAHQRLRISFPPADTTIAAEVMGSDHRSVHVRFRESLIGLEPQHLEQGVRISFWRSGGWYISDIVSVINFDLNAGTLQITQPQKTSAIQRRKTFREMVELPVHVAVLGNLFPPTEIGHKTVDLAAQSGITYDLGGGGLCLHSPDNALQKDQELRLELELPRHRIQARGKVQWVTSDSCGQDRSGIMFTRISEREQDLVYGFLFDLQRDRLRRGVAH